MSQYLIIAKDGSVRIFNPDDWRPVINQLDAERFVGEMKSASFERVGEDTYSVRLSIPPPPLVKIR